MNQSIAEPEIVGTAPWLPWPLSAWSWWTKPVRAERLALMRIGVGLCLLVDVVCLYAPDAIAYYGQGGLGDAGLFDYRFQAPRFTWSLIRGVGDGAMQAISLGLWLLASLWILGNGVTRLLLARRNPPSDDRSGIALWIWMASFAWYTASLWSQMVKANQVDALAWAVPLAGMSLVYLFVAIDLLARLRDPGQRIPWIALAAGFLTTIALLGTGILLAVQPEINKNSWWARLLGSWQDDHTLLLAAVIAWIGSAAFLLIGFRTRTAAVIAWLLSMSFANANMRLDNAGDTIRAILLFYLMLCPCGAVWSVDALFRRKPPRPLSPGGERGDLSGPVYVHPWPICLIFVQMIFMYWMNGLYKLFGETWREGSSLHYVLGDLALTRFSQVAWPMPFFLTRTMTWTVLAWENLFPLLVIFKWPRRVALCVGVMFHLGIFVSLELGPFVPYALCLYLPLIPFEWLDRSKAVVKATH